MIFFNNTPPTEIYTLSLHATLPTSPAPPVGGSILGGAGAASILGGGGGGGGGLQPPLASTSPALASGHGPPLAMAPPALASGIGPPLALTSSVTLADGGSCAIAIAGATASSITASIAANNISFLNFFHLLTRGFSLCPVFFHQQSHMSTPERSFFLFFLKDLNILCGQGGM